MNERGEYYVSRQQTAYNGTQNATCTQAQNNAPSNQDDGAGAAGWGVLGFFFPIVGFILWLVWKTIIPSVLARRA